VDPPASVLAAPNDGIAPRFFLREELLALEPTLAHVRNMVLDPRFVAG
jgi:hypothetical protein